MENWYVSTKGQPSPRWQSTFPQGHAVKREEFEAKAVPEGAIVWLLDEPGCRGNTLANLQRCAQTHPVVVMSNEPRDHEALQFYKLGARAYCHALAAPAVLNRVEAVLKEGGYWMGESVMAMLTGAVGAMLAGAASQVAPSLPGVLTERECDVAREVVHGATNREVAARLNITERTVKAHLTTIFDKLNVRDRMQLALLLNRPPPTA